MPLYERFDPPAFLPDLGKVPGLLDEWSKAVSQWFDSTIASEKQRYERHKLEPQVQYFNPLKSRPEGPVAEQSITWNAFPKELLRALPREEALAEADRLRPLSAYGAVSGGVLDRTLYRPQNEYCEWHVFRNERTGAIRKVVFVSEPPEYYQALFGGKIDDLEFHGDRWKVLDLYREHVSEEVQLKDLIAAEDIDLGGIWPERDRITHTTNGTLPTGSCILRRRRIR